MNRNAARGRGQRRRNSRRAIYFRDTRPRRTPQTPAASARPCADIASGEVQHGDFTPNCTKFNPRESCIAIGKSSRKASAAIRANAPETAIENTAKREVKNAMAQFRAFLDRMMQTNGDGVLGTISSITMTGLPSGVAAQFAMAKPPGAQLSITTRRCKFTIPRRRRIAVQRMCFWLIHSIR
jgi:hypothetical protein